MDCQTSQDLLPWLLNGTLEAEEAQEVDQHVKSCETCRQALAETADLGRGFLEHPPVEALVAYVERATPESEIEPLSRHVAACERCAEEVALARESRQAIARDELVLPAVDPQATEASSPIGQLLMPGTPFGRPATVSSGWRWAALAALLGCMIPVVGWRQAVIDYRQGVEIATAQMEKLENELERLALTTADHALQNPILGQSQRLRLTARERGGELPEAVMTLRAESAVVVIEFDCAGRGVVLFESPSRDYLSAAHSTRISPDLPRCEVRVPAEAARREGELRFRPLASEGNAEEVGGSFLVIFRTEDLADVR